MSEYGNPRLSCTVLFQLSDPFHLYNSIRQLWLPILPASPKLIRSVNKGKLIAIDKKKS